MTERLFHTRRKKKQDISKEVLLHHTNLRTIEFEEPSEPSATRRVLSCELWSNLVEHLIPFKLPFAKAFPFVLSFATAVAFILSLPLAFTSDLSTCWKWKRERLVYILAIHITNWSFFNWEGGWALVKRPARWKKEGSQDYLLVHVEKQFSLL